VGIAGAARGLLAPPVISTLAAAAVIGRTGLRLTSIVLPIATLLRGTGMVTFRQPA